MRRNRGDLTVEQLQPYYDYAIKHLSECPHYHEGEDDDCDWRNIFECHISDRSFICLYMMDKKDDEDEAAGKTPTYLALNPDGSIKEGAIT